MIPWGKTLNLGSRQEPLIANFCIAVSGQLPKRNQMPGTFRRGCFVTEYVQVAVVSADLEELVLLPIPLIEYLFDQILMPLQPETNRTFVRFSPRIAIDL